MKNCKYCDTPLVNQKNVFCNSSCAAKYNNPIHRVKSEKLCLHCGKPLINRCNKFCNLACFTEYQYVNITLPLFYKGGIDKNSTLRKILFKLYGEKCMDCDTGSQWNGKPLTLEVHHIDENSDNCMPENLRLLCPNCHSQNNNSVGNKSKKKTKRNSYLRKFKGYE